MPTIINQLSRRLPAKFRGRPILTKEDAHVVLTKYGVDLCVPPEDDQELRARHALATEWVDINGNLKAVPDRVRDCFGMARIVHSPNPYRCGDCRQRVACKKVVDVRVLNGLNKAMQFVDSREYLHSTAIFGAAEIILGWDIQHLEMKAKVGAERRAASRARHKAKAAAKRAEVKSQKLTREDQARPTDEAALEGIIAGVQKEFRDRQIGDTLASAANELRLDPKHRSTFSNRQLVKLGHYWVAEQTAEHAHRTGLAEVKRKTLVAVYHKLCGGERSEHAARHDADRKRHAFSFLRKKGLAV